MNDITSIQLKRQKHSTVVIFPGHEKQIQTQKANDFIKQVSEDRHKKFDFVQARLNSLRKEFKKEFNCDADYFIFNSINWE